VTCGYCGLDFTQDSAQPACVSCPMAKASGCGRVRCPRCGWEELEEPKFIQKFREWRRARHARVE
jgi:predicted Zn-ribbon and HTH transcriptional regulator